MSKKRLLWIGGIAAVVLGAFVLVFFQPQKLFIDDRVNEAPVSEVAEESQMVDPPQATDQALPAAPAEPEATELARAGFRSLEHSTTGEAVVTQFAGGRRVLRFEGFETSNGPDLRVYLSAGSSDAGFGKEYGEDFVELGRLKGNIGSQNYEIPAGIDLSRYRNAVVWCARFKVGFGVATLSP